MDSLFQGFQNAGTQNMVLSSQEYLSNAARTLNNIEVTIPACSCSACCDWECYQPSVCSGILTHATLIAGLPVALPSARTAALHAQGMCAIASNFAFTPQHEFKPRQWQDAAIGHPAIRSSERALT